MQKLYKEGYFEMKNNLYPQGDSYLKLYHIQDSYFSINRLGIFVVFKNKKDYQERLIRKRINEQNNIPCLRLVLACSRESYFKSGSLYYLPTPPALYLTKIKLFVRIWLIMYSIQELWKTLNCKLIGKLL